ncbi:VOC family protein [Nocardiopsis sp. CNR-923]|uniref:VOC family protein n=1 Tax=Nocardiopsis sp. CNR-923 TaxID=1904965 RepID=UPI002916C4A2|nr:VOC family protein [Nocardiopsis sp. CNR-923]
MITTHFVSGSPCWIELGSPDVAASVVFYRRVFGWSASEPAPDTGGYRMFQLDETPVAGLGPLMDDGQRPAWSVYFAAPDVDATARTVESLGGTVHAGPTDVMSFGRMVFCADPQGGDFGLWQAYDFPGMGVTDQDGTLCWVELWTPDGAAALSFYGKLFGWRFQDFSLADGLSRTGSSPRRATPRTGSSAGSWGWTRPRWRRPAATPTGTRCSPWPTATRRPPGSGRRAARCSWGPRTRRGWVGSPCASTRSRPGSSC